MNETLWAMFFVVFASNVAVPGPNVAFSVAQSLNYGFRFALPAAFGLSLATGCHALVVLSGVGLLARQYDVVLIALKWAGVAYLIYRAMKAFSPKSEFAAGVAQKRSITKNIFGAILVYFTNPHAIIAGFLIYPAFIDPNLPYFPQSLIITATSMSISFAIYAGYMFLAAKSKNIFLHGDNIRNFIGYLYIGAAAFLSFNT